MKRGSLWIAALALCAIGASAAVSHAAEIAVRGTITFVTVESSTMKLANGSAIERIHQKGIVRTEDPSSPFHLMPQDCQGTAVVGADGAVNAAGSCDATDKDGDVWWLWWRVSPTEALWGVIGGTGKFSGMTGGGTTKTDVQLADRNAISVEGTFTLK